MPGKQLIVFDFDWSFVDQDTDRFVLEVLSTKLRRKLQTVKKAGSQCTPDVVRECMIDLYEEGKTKDQILDSLRLLPFHPAMKRAVTELQARSKETTFVCISNSNTVYIDTILKHHNLTDLFHTIITNPAHFDTPSHPDKLLVDRRIPADSPNQHTCKVGCLENMCKGDELDKWITKNGSGSGSGSEGKGWEGWERVCYVGDGGNDFCPLLRMRPQDIAFVRKDMELHARIKLEGEKSGLKCQIKYWTGAWEIDEYFAEL